MYGMPNRGGLDAIALLAQKEGILLDPVYTGKAMAGLIDYLDNSTEKHRYYLCILAALKPFSPIQKSTKPLNNKYRSMESVISIERLFYTRDLFVIHNPKIITIPPNNAENVISSFKNSVPIITAVNGLSAINDPAPAAPN